LDGSEIEDLIPGELLSQVIDRWQREPERGFADFYQLGMPVVPQIETWAKANRVDLVAPGWKVEVAKRTKQALLSRNAKPIPAETLKIWEALFAALLK
jgi:hypothetical protein